MGSPGAVVLVDGGPAEAHEIAARVEWLPEVVAGSSLVGVFGVAENVADPLAHPSRSASTSPHAATPPPGQRARVPVVLSPSP